MDRDIKVRQILNHLKYRTLGVIEKLPLTADERMIDDALTSTFEATILEVQNFLDELDEKHKGAGI